MILSSKGNRAVYFEGVRLEISARREATCTSDWPLIRYLNELGSEIRNAENITK